MRDVTCLSQRGEERIIPSIGAWMLVELDQQGATLQDLPIDTANWLALQVMVIGQLCFCALLVTVTEARPDPVE